MAKRPRSKNKDGVWRKKRSGAGTESASETGAGMKGVYKVAGRGSRAPEIHASLKRQGRHFGDSTQITRADRDSR